MKRKAADVVFRIDRVRYEQSSQPVVCKKGKHDQYTKPPLLAGSLVLWAAAYVGSRLDDLGCSLTGVSKDIHASVMRVVLTWSSYFLKFSMNRLPSFSTSPLKSAVPFHDFAGLSSSSGTLGQVLGTERPKVS